MRRKQIINPLVGYARRAIGPFSYRIGQSTYAQTFGRRAQEVFSMLGFGADADGKVRMLPRGAGSVTFTRDTAGSLTDFESLVQTGQVEEMRFDLARRVQNELDSTEDFSDSVWGKSSGATVEGTNKLILPDPPASVFQFKDFGIKAGQTLIARVELYGEGVINLVLRRRGEGVYEQSNTAVTLTTNAKIYAVSHTFANDQTGFVLEIVRSSENYTAEVVWANRAQVEFGIVPSEYVSKGVLSGTPYHGVNVDGVAEFAYENGNSVDGNGVVTDAKGADLTTEWGALFEPGSTNYCTKSEKLDEAPWTTNSVTVTSDFAVGPDGRQTAERLQYAGSLGSPDSRTVRCFEPIAVGTASKTFVDSIYLKSNTGSNQTVRLQNTHGGVTFNFSSDLTVTAEWQRFLFKVTNSAAAGDGNQSIGVVAPTTDASFDVLATGAQIEENVLTSYVPTDGTAVTRTVDDGSGMFNLEGNLDQSKGSLVVDLRWTSNYDDISEEVEELIAVSQLTRGLLFYCSNPATIPIGLYSFDQTNLCKIDLPFVANKTYRIGLTWSVANGINLSWKNITDAGAWQTWANTPFDGMYTTVGTSIRIARLDDLYRPVLFRDLRIWQQDQGTDFIEDNY